MNQSLVYFWLYFFPLFWLIIILKKILFWLWLWQLKEYHTGRFLDHFRTEKGKNLFINWLLILKAVLLLKTIILVLNINSLIIWLVEKKVQIFIKTFFSYWIYFPFILLFLYFLEVGKTLKDFFSKKIKKPVLTGKTFILFLVNFIFALVFISYHFSTKPFSSLFFSFPEINILFDISFWLLTFDFLSPVVITFFVFLFQPVFVFFRNKLIIEKAIGKREKFKNLIVIGITGSYGKTSTKEFLYTILSEKFSVLKTEKNQNSEVGVSQTILKNLKPEHEIFICEMGAYNRGGIKFISKIAKPKIGIITGINEQHMATFGSQENIVKAKYELIESLPEDGTAFFNGDNVFCKQLFKNSQNHDKFDRKEEKVSKKIIRSSHDPISVTGENIPWDLETREIKIEKENISFSVFSKNKKLFSLKLNLLGTHNISNVLLAIAVAKKLGMGNKEILKGAEKIKPHQRTMEIKNDINGASVIDDSYSANPKGVMAALDYLSVWEGKKVIVMPCLIELGKASKRIHQEIGAKIGKICDFAIITTKERFKEIQKGAIESGMPEKNILFLEDSKKIYLKIEPYLRKGNVILLESRVPKKLMDWLIKR